MDPEESASRQLQVQIDRLNALLAAARAERDRLQDENARTGRLIDEIMSRKAYQWSDRLGRLRTRVTPRRSRSKPAEVAGPPVPAAAAPLPPGLLIDVTPLQESARSGIARVTVELARAMQAEGQSVVPVRPTPAGWLREDRFAAVLGGVAAVAGAAPVPRPPTVVSAAVHNGDQLPALRAAVDQLHAQGGQYLQIVHDLIPITEPDFFPLGMRRHFPVWLREAVLRADVVACDSDATRGALAQWLSAQGLQSRAPLLSCPLAPFLPPGSHEPADPRMVLSVGTVEPRKGLECVVAAAQTFADEGADVRFVVVGAAGWADEGLLARLRAADADPDFPLSWLQSADDEELQRLYRSAAVVLAPSRAEGFGLPIVEAMAAGTPVLARRLPVFEELVSDDASFFTLDADLVPALRARLADPQLSAPVRPGRSWRDTAHELLAALAAPAVDRDGDQRRS